MLSDDFVLDNKLYLKIGLLWLYILVTPFDSTVPAAPEGRQHWYDDTPKYALLVTNSITEKRTTHTVKASGVAKVELHAFSGCQLQAPEKELPI